MKLKNKKHKDESFSLDELNGLLEALNKNGCEMLKIFEEQPDFPEEGQNMIVKQIQREISNLKTLIKEKNETLTT
jgi:hypothetical protein